MTRPTPYRSDLAAALARLDALEPKSPCRACARRRARHWRWLGLVGKVFVGLVTVIVGVVVAVTMLLLLLLMMWRPAFG